MITCPKCGNELEDGAKFCNTCGARIDEAPANETPVNETPVNETPVSETPANEAPVSETPVNETPAAAPAGNKKFPKKAILFGGIGVAVLAVLILVISLVACNGGKSQNNYALYVKDSEFFLADLQKDDKPWQLSSNLVDGDGLGNKELAEAGYGLGRYVYLSKDGKYIFFPDKIGDSTSGFNLYCRKASDPDAEPVKIDSDVQSYYVNSSATLITYQKDGTLYQYKLGEDTKEKIASDVSSFVVSDDGKKILYRNDENSIYLKYADKDKEKIASDVYTIDYTSEDLSTLYYIKDGALYKQVEGEDRVKIASEIDSVIRIYDSGEIYYTTTEITDLTLMDLVDDDRKEADAALVEPEYPDFPESPDYPSWFDYETQEEYNAAVDAYEEAYDKWEDEVDRMEEEYDKAREAYREKLNRDNLREELERQELKQIKYTLCFYNGTETVVVTDAFDGEGYHHDYAPDTPVITYQTVTKNTDGKVKLSEIESVYDVRDMVEDAADVSYGRYVAVKEKATLIETEGETDGFQVSPDGSVIYYACIDSEDTEQGDFYRIEISGGEVKSPELYDSDVYVHSGAFINDNDFGYFKDYKNGKGELYINKNKVDFDVHAGGNIRIDAENDKIYYFTDWNSEKGYGTLKVYDGKESVKIADDVHSVSVALSGRVLFLTDYSLSYYKGTLNEWDDGKTRKLDEDVVCVVDITTEKDD